MPNMAKEALRPPHRPLEVPDFSGWIWLPVRQRRGIRSKDAATVIHSIPYKRV